MRHADPTVGAHFARSDAQALAEVVHQRLAVEHAIGDVVAEEHTVVADGPHVEEPVEARNPLHFGERQPQCGGDGRHVVARQPPVRFLRLAQDLY